MQPFQHQKHYISRVWPELGMMVKEGHISVSFPFLLDTLSSAVYGGGFQKASHFVNWQVPAHYNARNPIQHMEQQLGQWGYRLPDTVALQTAARIRLASIQEEAGDGFRIVCCVTAGIGNRARAGKRRKTYAAYECGTINIFLFIDGCLTSSAMVNAIITATEAKAAVLQDWQITDEDGELATGTTTDAIVVAVSQKDTYPVHQFAGAATTIGNSIGRLVYAALDEILQYLKGG